VTSLLGLAGIFIGLSAFFVGGIQILVYTGAIMVLFIFIIMLLDIKAEKARSTSWLGTTAGIALAAIFIIQLIGVLGEPLPNQSAPPLNPETFAVAAENFRSETHIARELNEGKLPDVHLIGHTLFTEYNFPLQILGVLLLVATVGVVVLSKRQSERES
jgi:NADH-quinone oxidoreductase subunit J